MISRRVFLKLSLSAAAFSAMPAGAYAFSGYGYDKPQLMQRLSRPQDTYKILTSKDYFKKIKHFNHAFNDDLMAGRAEFELIRSCARKTGALMHYVGYGNFNILNFDEALKFMDGSGPLQPFTKAELDYIDELFARDASVYGFYGERVFTRLTEKVDGTAMVKIPGSGHFVYKAHSLSTYSKITKEMKSLILTSGVRSVVKQLHLFLHKAVETGGNLSMASRSIAPVGYSYHGIGDFDVGIKGWGFANFTDKFATTREYARLMKDGYMRIRYDRKNPYGVRFEPWHVKVV